VQFAVLSAWRGALSSSALCSVFGPGTRIGSSASRPALLRIIAFAAGACCGAGCLSHVWLSSSGIVSTAGFSMLGCRIVIASPPSWPSRHNYVFKPTAVQTLRFNQPLPRGGGLTRR